jgi:hypothetical protein
MKHARSITFTVLVLVIAFASVAAQRPGGGGPAGPGGPGRPGGGGPGGPGGPGAQGGGPGRFPGDGPMRPGADQPPPHGERPPAFGPRADFLSSEMRFGDRVIKGRPYSAQFSTESTQLLADGTRITRKSNGSVYRNGEGRTRREQTVNSLGPIPVEGGPRQLIFINDPLGGAHYVLDVQDHSARKLPLKDGPPGDAKLPREFEDSPDPVSTMSLGRHEIEGVMAEGTRSTITIPVGRIGNDRALEVVSERWYSPELQVVVLSKHNDPFSGENVYRLTGISRTEPAASMFEIPADYRITEEGPPMGPRKPRQ